MNKTIILFNNESYRQLDGVDIGSLLHQVFANIFLSLQEVLWLSNCRLDFRPKIFDNPQQPEIFK